MSQSTVSQRWFNPRTVLASAALLAVFGVAGCNGMGTGASSTLLAVKVTNDTLTDQHGVALYMFDRDVTAGRGACNGECAKNWPPLAANDADEPPGDYTIIARDDGKKQWAYRGKPLYLWTKGKMPSDQTGDGFMDVWHVARP